MIMPGDGIFQVRVHIGFFGKNRHQREVFVAGRAKRPKALDIRDCHNNARIARARRLILADTRGGKGPL